MATQQITSTRSGPEEGNAVVSTAQSYSPPVSHRYYAFLHVGFFDVPE